MLFFFPSVKIFKDNRIAGAKQGTSVHRQRRFRPKPVSLYVQQVYDVLLLHFPF